MPAKLIFEEGNVAVYDVLNSGDAKRIESLLGLYENLFPQYRGYIPRMRRRAQFASEHRAGQVVHYWLVEVDGQSAGLRTFRYINHRNVGLAHALAIDPSFRETRVQGKRLSVFLIYECLAQILRDAVEKGAPPPLGMVNEVELERLMEHYTRNGLIQLPIQYLEPIFPPEVEGRSRAEELAETTFSPMRMGFLPNPHVKIEKYTHEMIEEFALAFLVDHYGLPMEHPIVLRILESIKE
jgi:hypothetical protein